ncbi:MAG: hypothetical protein FJY42_02330 [Betaproteobacteria bacterium]|nr:hypothetical protein [Betaproteobacteria bacterium]
MSDFTVRIANASDIERVAGLFNLYRQFYEQLDDLALATSFIRDRTTQDESLVTRCKRLFSSRKSYRRVAVWEEPGWS